jgi:topoisomerase-4 subunit A
MELIAERDALMIERAEIEDLLESEDLQWKAIAEQLRDTRKAFGRDTPGGARRTQFGEAGDVADVPLEAMIDKEPITVVCSKMGWIRAMTGHIDLARELKFKDGDGPRFIFHAETTDRILVFGDNGRFYTVPASNLPGGRGMGEPLRLMVDLPNEAQIVDLFAHKPGEKLLVASAEGNGFVVPEADVIAQTRSGKQVLNVKDTIAQVCHRIAGDHVAVVSENARLLVFPVDDLPEMSRGKGVRIQKYNKARGKQGMLELDGGLSDITTFKWEDGLSWEMGGGRTRTEADMSDWKGARAGVGKRPPHGFPKSNKFS